MRRLVAAAAMILLLLPVLSCAAADDFSVAYTPKSENSSVFYIDVSCERAVTGAVFELSFDDSAVSYYSVTAIHSTSTVRDYVRQGTVSAAFADSGPVSGNLCRFSFKALQEGTTSFVLHTEQAADADKNTLTDWDDFTLSVRLGKDDVVSAGSTARNVSIPKATTVSSKGGGQASTIEKSEDERNLGIPELINLQKSNTLKWILIGAGIPVLVAGLLVTGVMIGRWNRQKEKPSDDETPDRHEHNSSYLDE